MKPLFSRKIIDNAWIFLPITTTLLLVATLPPINLWPLGFIALAPMYLFLWIYFKSSWRRLAWGGFFFALMFSSVLLSLTILQFGWIKEAHLFTIGIKMLFIPTAIAVGVIGAFGILFSRMLASRSALLNILVFASVWTSVEWFIKKLMFSLEYSILAYPAKDTFFLSLAGIGGVFLVVFVMALVNASVGSVVFYIFALRAKIIPQKEVRQGIIVSLGVIVFAVGGALVTSIYYTRAAPSTTKESVRIAIIQDQERSDSAFGKEIYGEFKFPDLERQISEANLLSPDIIIYPFAPWVGALGKENDNELFDRPVIGADFSSFGKWENAHVKPGVVLITWNTVYRYGKFYNELNFWKDGEIIGVYQKKTLFPFMDYTPRLAQSIGLYTTPYDATPGVETTAIPLNGIRIGGLVCSEINKSIPRTSIADMNLVLAIGSEAIFSNGVAGEINLANAQFRAAESGRMIIRANRFGPSAFIDTHGKITSSIPYGTNGILFEETEVSTGNKETPYSKGGGNIFMLVVFGFLFILTLAKKYGKMHKPLLEEL